jgi:hypothetical protein
VIPTAVEAEKKSIKVSNRKNTRVSIGLNVGANAPTNCFNQEEDTPGT